MSKYIPTKETVIACYHEGANWDFPQAKAVSEQQINDWLNNELLLERERIIKLLEADMGYAFGDDGKCIYEKHHREVCNCDVIALIKGKTK